MSKLPLDMHWKVSGGLVYLLEGKEYRKGVPVWQNALTVNVQAGRNMPQEMANKLTKKLHAYLEELHHENFFDIEA